MPNKKLARMLALESAGKRQSAVIAAPATGHESPARVCLKCRKPLKPFCSAECCHSH